MQGKRRNLVHNVNWEGVLKGKGQGKGKMCLGISSRALPAFESEGGQGRRKREGGEKKQEEGRGESCFGGNPSRKKRKTMRKWGLESVQREKNITKKKKKKGGRREKGTPLVRSGPGKY